jgi:hypothetical protein
MAATENQPFIQSTGLLVEWRPNDTFDDNDDTDYVYTPEVDDNNDFDDQSWDDTSSDDFTISTNNITNKDEDTFLPHPSEPIPDPDHNEGDISTIVALEPIHNDDDSLSIATTPDTNTPSPMAP